VRKTSTAFPCIEMGQPAVIHAHGGKHMSAYRNDFWGKGGAIRAACVASFLGLTTFGISDAHASGNHSATQVATAATPTVSEFLNASNAEYVISNTAPVGMKPFKVLGIPITYTNVLDGVSAKVWVTAENQVVIAYQGTAGGDNILVDPAILIPQLLDDLAAATLNNPPAYGDALGFAKVVVGLANAEGYATANVFVTGHSLGGIEAEYVASQTGLGGIGFESTGIPAKDITSQATNFVNTAEFGDPVANFTSDISGEQPFCPAYVPQGGTDPHYGLIIQFGAPADQTTLTQAMSLWGVSGNDDLTTLANWAGLFLAHHFPGVQAHDLGVTLSPYSILADGGGTMTAPVWNVASLTIPQFVAAASANGLLVNP